MFKKFLLVFVLILAMVFTMAACNKDEDEGDASDSSDTSESSTSNETGESKVSVSADGYLTVNGVKTEYKVDSGNNGVPQSAPPDIRVDENGYVVVNGVKTQYMVSNCKHIWDTVNTPATCTTGGYDTKTCTACGAKEIVNPVPALEHSISAEYTVEGEYHWLACTRCGEVSSKGLHTEGEDGECAVCATPMSATPGIIYDVSDDGTYAMVISYDGTAEKVRIAEEDNGLPVKAIYDSAFSDNDSITQVIIPNGVTSIGDYAFDGCESLRSITIPNGVTSIGNRAFYYCTSLTSIEIPNSVTSIGYSAFSWCFSLTSVNFAENSKLTSIGDSAFSSCYRLTSVTIGSGVTSIGDSAFNDCTSLTSVYIDDIASWCNISFEYFPDFYCANPLCYASNLYLKNASGEYELVTELVIPDTVTEIKDYAFYYCDSLTSIDIPNSVTSIGEGAFEYCSSLTSITIPDSVVSVSASAFIGCNSELFTEYSNGKYLGDESNPYKILVGLTSQNLSSYEIHEDTKIIVDYVFSGCDRITSITIPDSVTSIGSSVFSWCDSLTSVTFANTSGWWYSSDEDATSGTSISSSYLASPSTAATYLKSTYYYYYWKRS